jgi:hypothetical protein
MKKRKHISSAQESNSKAEELMKYLNNRLSSDKEWELENQMMSSPLMQDAEEGLQMLPQKEKLPEVVKGLNQQLKHRLKKKRLIRQNPPGFHIIWISLLLLLILIVLIYLFIINKSGI